jgi:RNA polymerase sigma-70 factor (ECF subfamily)
MNELTNLLETLRPQLLRYARLQLHNDAWAEDAVSETLLAAIEKPEAFAGRAQPKTWLTGILKHKLVDQMRRSSGPTPKARCASCSSSRVPDARMAGTRNR